MIFFVCQNHSFVVGLTGRLVLKYVKPFLIFLLGGRGSAKYRSNRLVVRRHETGCLVHTECPGYWFQVVGECLSRIFSLPVFW